MWILTPFGKTRLALTGVPWRDLTDAEYAAAKRRHPGIEDQGYFSHLTAAEFEAQREAEVLTDMDSEEPPVTPPAEEETNDG